MKVKANMKSFFALLELFTVLTFYKYDIHPQTCYRAIQTGISWAALILNATRLYSGSQCSVLFYIQQASLESCVFSSAWHQQMIYLLLVSFLASLKSILH